MTRGRGTTSIVLSSGRWIQLLFGFVVLTCTVQQFPYLSIGNIDQKSLDTAITSFLPQTTIGPVNNNFYHYGNSSQSLLTENPTNNNDATMGHSATSIAASEVRVHKKEEIPQPSHRRRRGSFLSTINHETINETNGFAACLIMMDDNHFLIEWLAYHSYVLPLKYLIVAIDPKSKTSPVEILQRYQGIMEIEFWQDEDYMPQQEHQGAVLLDKNYNLTTPNKSEAYQGTELHLVRQRIFYMECMRQLQTDNRTYTAVVDTDEFLVPNPNAFDEFNFYRELNMSLPPLLSNLSSSTDQHYHYFTLWDLLHMVRQQTKRFTTLKRKISRSCLSMTRLSFSTQSEASAPILAHEEDANAWLFNTSQFLTLRYQHHFGLKNFQKNRKAKTIMDVSKIPNHSLYLKNIYAHRPVMSECSMFDEFIGNRKSPVVAHHYVGTWKQWTFRDDPRSWTRKKQGKYAKFAPASGNNMVRERSATTWLDGFVQLHGQDKVQALFRDVGYVPPKEMGMTNQTK